MCQLAECKSGRTVASTRLHMDFRAHPGAATNTRNFIAGIHSKILKDQEIIDRISITVHELIENLIKYASTRCATLEVVLEVLDDSVRVIVRTCNTSTSDRLAQLEQVFDMINSDLDPIEIYDEAITRSLLAGDDWSGLGLARIRAEAEMSLSYEISGQEVTISAEWSGTQSLQDRRNAAE